MTGTFRNLLAVLVLVAVAGSYAYAAGDLDTLRKGPPVGATMPHSLALTDHNNQHRDFKSLAGRRGLLLMFGRSVDW